MRESQERRRWGWAMVLLASCFVGATPAAALDDVASEDERPSLLVMRFSASGVDPETVQTVEGIAADAFAKTERFRVLSAADIKELMDLEGEKTALGCNDTDCLAEVAGALGADLVVTGQLGKLGRLYVLKLTLLRPAAAESIASESIEVDRIELLAKRVRTVARDFAIKATGKSAPSSTGEEVSASPKPEPEEPESSGVGRWVFGGGAGIAALGVAGLGGSIAATVVGMNLVWAAGTDGGTKELMRDTAPFVIYGAGVLGAVGAVAGIVATVTGGVMWLAE